MRENFKKAFANDFIVLFISLFVMYLFTTRYELSFQYVIILTTIPEIAAICIFIIRKRSKCKMLIKYIFNNSLEFYKWKELIESWAYGKWLLFSSLSSYILQYAQILILPIYLPFTTLAGYKAIQIFAQPIQVVTNGIEGYMLSHGNSVYKKSGLHFLSIFLYRMMMVNTLIFIGYTFLVSVFSRRIIELLYGNKYNEYYFLISIFCITFIIMFLVRMIGSGLLVLGDTKKIFYVFLIGGVFNLIFLFSTIEYFQLLGAALSNLVANIIILGILMLYWINRNIIKNHE